MNTHAVLQRLLVNRWLAWVLAAPLLALAAMTALQYRTIESETEGNLGKAGSMLVAGAQVQHERILNDYEDFYIVGRLLREGDIVSAYDNDDLTAAQERFTGTSTFMPWAYPPPLTALVGLLPLAGLAGSYMLFIVGTLALYLWSLARYDWRMAGAGLLAVYPALLLNIRLGQNGLLSGALIGLALLGLARGHASAGVPMGLMVFKPHLTAAFGLLALLQRRWTALAIAAALGIAACIAATVVLGWRVWPAFFAGVSDAGGYLREGMYPLYRMSSIYAGVRSFGAAPHSAMAIHILGAAAVLGLLALAWKRQVATRRLSALACLATVLVSPYNYDYDTACLAIAVILVLPEILARARAGEIMAFYVLCWIGTGSGLAQHMRSVLIAGTTDHAHGTSLNWSLQAGGLLAAAAFAALILARKPAFRTMSARTPDERAIDFTRGAP